MTAAGGRATGAAAPRPIDRRALVDRHAVTLHRADTRSPLSVGNGELCFTADVTGLQTFPGDYPVRPQDGGGTAGTLLGTQAQWAWHSVPPSEPHDLASTAVTYDTPHGPVPYVDMLRPRGRSSQMAGALGAEGAAQEAERWLRANPHRLDLARIGLDFAGADVSLADVQRAHQTLDLWRGVLTSRFTLRGEPVEVTTVCHPRLDLVAVRVVAAGVRDGRLGIRIAFPYGSQEWHNAADWSCPDAHATRLKAAGDVWLVTRELDATTYHARLAGPPGTGVEQVAEHALLVRSGAAALELTVHFGSGPAPDAAGGEAAPAFGAVAASAAEHWERFWTTGGAVELAGSRDPRAPELERRTVLSQYLTAINCAGSLPPQETGLLCNSWRGRFHLEMHWWHAAHFALWGRAGLLERSLGWYASVLERARETARWQGYEGARWPKQVGPDGRESPSPIGPFLVWQQPHVIHLAELVWRARAGPAGHADPAVNGGSRDVLERYADLVLATADFMAGFPVRTGRGIELGPPLVPAQESYWPQRARMRNPTFELAYWHWGLETAQRWRARLGLERSGRWDAVSRQLVRPRVRDGVYAAVDTEPYTVRNDHPSMLCALGFVPATPLIDAPTMRATLEDVLAGWDWDSTWGWDYPVAAMCATRLGAPSRAVDALLMDTAKNRFLANGHNWQSPSLPAYLPGNGGLLAAMALMTAGWDGAPQGRAPGFPDDERWAVTWEGLTPSP